MRASAGAGWDLQDRPGAMATSLTPVNDTGAVSRPLLEALAGGVLPDWGRMAGRIELRRLAPGQALFHAGAPATDLYVVRSGILRLAYEGADGRHWIKGFVPEGRFFASARALAGDGRAAFRADALEASRVECLPYALVEQLGREHMRWQQAIAAGFRLFGLRKEQREHDLLTLDAAGRYARFMAEFATVAARIPLKDVAAYVGVTPVALSRIRRRLGLVAAARARAATAVRPCVHERPGKGGAGIW